MDPQINSKDQAVRTIETIGGQGLVPTIAPIDKLEAVVKQVELLKKKLALDEEVLYYGEDGKPCPKDKAVALYVPRKPLRTYMMAFNLSNEIIGEEKFEGEDSEGKYYIWRYRVKIIMANGRFVTQIGACSSRDPFFSKKYGKRVDPDEANIMHKALTAALNRGISDILGGTIPTDEDVKMRHAEYLLKRSAGVTEGSGGQKQGTKRGRPAKKEEQPPEKAEPATKTDEDVLLNLMNDPVFSDTEREKACKWIDQKQNQKEVREKIEGTKQEIEERKKVLQEEKKQSGLFD